MTSKLTKVSLRGMLDEMKIYHKVDDDGDYVIVQEADKDFEHDVYIWMILNEETNVLSILGKCPGLKIDNGNKAQSIVKCNSHNSGHHFMTAFLGNDEVISVRQSFLFDEEVSEKHIKEDCIKFTFGMIWRFYCQFLN